MKLYNSWFCLTFKFLHCYPSTLHYICKKWKIMLNKTTQIFFKCILKCIFKRMYAREEADLLRVGFRYDILDLTSAPLSHLRGILKRNSFEALNKIRKIIFAQKLRDLLHGDLFPSLGTSCWLSATHTHARTHARTHIHTHLIKFTPIQNHWNAFSWKLERN